MLHEHRDFCCPAEAVSPDIFGARLASDPNADIQLAHAYEQATAWSAIRPFESFVMTREQPDGCACA